MQAEQLCIFRIPSEPMAKFYAQKNMFKPSIVLCSTDPSKAVVLMLYDLCMVLW